MLIARRSFGGASSRHTGFEWDGLFGSQGAEAEHRLHP
jgi:hypothetical protein